MVAAPPPGYQREIARPGCFPRPRGASHRPSNRPCQSPDADQCNSIERLRRQRDGGAVGLRFQVRASVGSRRTCTGDQGSRSRTLQKFQFLSADFAGLTGPFTSVVDAGGASPPPIASGEPPLPSPRTTRIRPGCTGRQPGGPNARLRRHRTPASASSACKRSRTRRPCVPPTSPINAIVAIHAGRPCHSDTLPDGGIPNSVSRVSVRGPGYGRWSYDPTTDTYHVVFGSTGSSRLLPRLQQVDHPVS
jgi:hypothetical protein